MRQGGGKTRRLSGEEKTCNKRIHMAQGTINVGLCTRGREIAT